QSIISTLRSFLVLTCGTRTNEPPRKISPLYQQLAQEILQCFFARSESFLPNQCFLISVAFCASCGKLPNHVVIEQPAISIFPLQIPLGNLRYLTGKGYLPNVCTSCTYHSPLPSRTVLRSIPH